MLCLLAGLCLLSAHLYRGASPHVALQLKFISAAFRTLGALAEKCHAFAKALHYKEYEYATTPGTAVEALISINNQLRQPEAAIGILTMAQQTLHMELKVRVTFNHRQHVLQGLITQLDRCVVRRSTAQQTLCMELKVACTLRIGGQTLVHTKEPQHTAGAMLQSLIVTISCSANVWLRLKPANTLSSCILQLASGILI